MTGVTPAEIAMDRLATRGGRECPVCGHAVADAVDLGDYQLFRCPQCRCWSSNALLRDAATSFAPSDYFEHAGADRDKWETLVARLRGRPAPRRVLDVGCGTGVFLEFMGRTFAGLHREGVELDPGRAAQARARNAGATIHVGDAWEVLRGLSGPFDVVTLWDVFEHVTAPRELLAELARVLGPDGVIYVQTIHERSLLPLVGRLAFALSGGRLRYPVRRTHDAHHLVFFTIAGLRRLADGAGLRIRDTWYDRLARQRMDGHPVVTALASLALRVENALGGGLFVNVLLAPHPPADASR
jgi:2-polyprenyl-3-methyl-5-hydroxy-6-metoxy-1,4-benzoquinol methylase